MPGDEPRESDSATTVFDPRALRHFSILPDEDADEAHCVRHDREMRAVDPVVHTQGALYTTATGVSVYTCPRCLVALGHLAERDGSDLDGGGAPADIGLKAYQHSLREAFDQWDQGDAPRDWFRYLGEGTIEDFGGEGTGVTFDEPIPVEPGGRAP